MIKCGCGCGELIHERDNRNRIRKSIRGHMNPFHLKGADHPAYINGEASHSKGYLMKYSPDHHFATKKGYVMKHRLLWEEANSACLFPWSSVHHKDGNKRNNDISNLEAMMTYQHNKLEAIKQHAMLY